LRFPNLTPVHEVAVRLASFVACVLLFAAPAAFAQPPAPTPGALRPISPDHYFLQYAFSLDHNRKAKQIAGAKVSNKDKGDAMEDSRASQLGVSLAELKKLDQALDKLEKDARVIETKAKSLIDDAKKKNQTPDKAQLRKIESERYATIVLGMRDLYASLTPVSAEALRKHLNETYRRNVYAPAN
jgi:hypothetical protein